MCEKHIVMIPLFNMDVNNDKYVELIQQAKTTLNNRKYRNKDKKIIFGKHIYNLSNNKYIADIHINSYTIYVVAHHEHFGKIGLTKTNDGMSPQEFVDKLVNVTSKDNLHKIIFYTCNSAYHDYDLNLSYCGITANILWNKYNAKHIMIYGFDGYLYEDIKKKRTYISNVYDCYKKKKRAEDNMICFKYK
jgi:hypothetical protein